MDGRARHPGSGGWSTAVDAAAFLADYGDALRRRVRRVARSGGHDPDDLWQEVVTRLIPRLPFISCAPAAFQYARRIAASTSREWARQRRDRDRLLLSSVEEDRLPQVSDAAAAVLRAAEREALHAALARLPARQRVAVELDADELSRADVAALMCVPETAVKALLQRGRARLRAELAVSR